MTICIAVKVAEGLVLAADSAVMLQGTIKTPQGDQDSILQTFMYANKVSRLKDYPIGVMSWGAGSINARSIQSLVMEFEYKYPDRTENQNYKVETVANDLAEFIKARYDAAYPIVGAQPVLGLFIGGYSDNEFFADEFVFKLPASTGLVKVRPDKPDGSPNFGADWYGMTDALTRLIKGFDPAALDDLIKRGVDVNIVQQWVNDAASELPLIFDGMPLQDAIDFAEYAAQVVLGRFRFGIGPALCGGDIDIAVITPTNYKWAKCKQWAIKE